MDEEERHRGRLRDRVHYFHLLGVAQNVGPNSDAALNIPLYIVAPDERREKVLAEVNRPTFSRLAPPMNQIYRYISFSALRDRVPQMADMTGYLTPEFLEELSESCEVEEI